LHEIENGLGHRRIFGCWELVLIKIVLVELYRRQGCQAAVFTRYLEVLEGGRTNQGGPRLTSGICCGFLLLEYRRLFIGVSQLRRKKGCALRFIKAFRLKEDTWGHEPCLRQRRRLRLTAKLLLLSNDHVFGRQDRQAGAAWFVL